MLLGGNLGGIGGLLLVTVVFDNHNFENCTLLELCQCHIPEFDCALLLSFS